MDTYDLYHEIQKVWIEHSGKNSGELHKKFQHMATVVWTPEGHREVIGVKWNSEIRAIELILDTE
jgi:hypothetical protein